MTILFEFIEFVWWWVGEHLEYVMPIIVFLFLYLVGTLLIKNPTIAAFFSMKVTDMSVGQLFILLLIIAWFIRK